DRRVARRDRRRLAPERGAGRADGEDRDAGPLRRARHLGRDPAPRRHDLVEGHRRREQGSRRRHLQDRGLRRRRRSIRVRARLHRGGQEGQRKRMNLAPSDTERELAAAVRTWADDLGYRVEKGERVGTLPLEVVRELGDLGVLGMTVPEHDGGLGASTVAFALVLEELAAAWPSLAVGVSVNSGIVAGSIVRYGTAGQRARWLPRLMSGEGLGAFALTEP